MLRTTDCRLVAVQPDGSRLDLGRRKTVVCAGGRTYVAADRAFQGHHVVRGYAVGPCDGAPCEGCPWP